MQLATFLATYQPGLDGDYNVTWDHTVDFHVHRTLAGLADMTPAQANVIEVKAAILHVDGTRVRAMWDPEGKVPVMVTYRINKLPASFKARLVFFAGDVHSLEPVHVEPSAPLPC